MSKPIGSYLGSFNSTAYVSELEDEFGSYFERLNRIEKLSLLATFSYYLFHQEVVQDSLGEYKLIDAAIGTMCGIAEPYSLAIEVCQILSGQATLEDLESLIKFVCANLGGDRG